MTRVKLLPIKAYRIAGLGTQFEHLRQVGAEWNGMIELRTKTGEALILSRETSVLGEVFADVLSDGATEWSVVKASPSLLEKLNPGSAPEATEHPSVP